MEVYIYNHQDTSAQTVTFCSEEAFQIKSTKLWVSYKPWETQLYSSNGHILIITNLSHFTLSL